MTTIENGTIDVREQAISAALTALGSSTIAQTQPDLAALQFLAPAGFRPIVELQEDGRKKRRTASAQNWSAETGEILIYFERVPDLAVQASPPATSRTMTPPPSYSETHSLPLPQADASITQAAEISELCSALNAVEQEGRSFVALKWFRDDVLVARGYSWSTTAERRQAVLTKAIESGAVLTNKIPNPKAPLHPTTTVRLNRSSSLGVSDVVRPRFRPIPVRGEMVSTTLLRDRGAS